MWHSKCQERLQKHADKLFHDWLQTKAGRNWQLKWSRTPPKIVKKIHLTLSASSPYAHGFSLPQYHLDLIEALGRNDEVAAKAIMLEHYV